ncbi:hypothetical protein Q0601_20730 [Paracoccus onubensis]|uniref:hypothetical protein n=1 Tax=Paracoccus onubensis TaxID=1675788 RepID=UPI0027311605|nr:hypothetical protein [Paracoccus onubensis]MDP0929617.1 hypothetical protein [Paracoccus onubensis]
MRDVFARELNDRATRRKPVERIGPANPSELMIGEVLARYADDKGENLAVAGTLIYSIQALAPLWGSQTCASVKGSTCRRYEREWAKPRTTTTITKSGRVLNRQRKTGSSTVRRELGVLQAAEYFGTTFETIRKHYWHHSPHHQQEAVETIERSR